MKQMSALPPVLRTAPLDRPYRQAINSDILRPVSINQTSCKFVFDRVGILDSNSQLQLAQTVTQNNANSAVNTGAYLPTSTGALAMISRCYMTIGGKMISDLRDLPHFSTYHRLQLSNEYKKGILNPKQGGNDNFQGSIGRRILANGNTAKRSRGFDEPFGVLSRPSSSYAVSLAQATFGTQLADETNTAEVEKRQLTNDENTTPTFSVGLSQLIPFLKAEGGLQLPLGLIKEEVAIVVEFNDGNDFGHRFCVPTTDKAGNPLLATECTSKIVENKVLMMVDYLFYPEQILNVAQDMVAKGGYNVPYSEVLVSESVKTAVNGANTFSFNLSFAGKRVKNMIIQKQLIENVPANEVINNIGRYNSLAWKNNESYNLQINSRNFYSRSISNVGLQKSEADMASTAPLQLCGARYSWNNNWDGAVPNNLLSDRLTNGYANDSEEASQHWLGIKIQNFLGQGVRINNVPMNYTEQINAVAGDDPLTRRYRFFVETQRVVNLSNGLVTVIE